MTAKSEFDPQKWNTVMSRIAHQQEGQQDATISPRRLRYLGNNEVKLPSRLDAGYKVVKLTDHAKQQVLQHTGVPYSFLAGLEQRNSKLATEVVNDGFQSLSDSLFWRFSDDRIRGVLSKRTSSVDNVAIVESVDSVLRIGESDFIIRSVSLDDNRFYLKILFDTEFRDETGIKVGNYLKMGVVCRSSETHHGQVSVKPFVYRWSCTNDAVVATDRSFVAKSFNMTEMALRNGVSGVVAFARLEAEAIMSNMVKGQQRTVSKPQRRLQDLAKENSFTKAETRQLVQAYRKEPMPTEYGIAQAFTRMAQALTLDARDRVEAIGGQLMQAA